VNNHHPVRSQQFALDIVELGPLGYRATGLMPRDLASYAIYGRAVLSPCDGTVLEAVGSLPDLPIGERDSSQPAGNHVVIRCHGVRVELAHLQRASVRVTAGDAVRAGTPLGLVGNSGNTSEPHLHVHADTDGGEGVPMTFDGRFLIRNDRWLQAEDPR
jgi:murein DD-endopeptidase MepM/ murein hydrolase activator NlpD